ncbi:hypothetical protein E2C01_009400 [Portunus trituberculatus]|uniref:Uncharacterized protein n=1 Tax=Portunus trituberculatus TaxID=210409 RepID=A0A5B7D4X8_PORTR|nr:hypothetical protein [Portunus trituberculatus]
MQRTLHSDKYKPRDDGCPAAQGKIAGLAWCQPRLGGGQRVPGAANHPISPTIPAPHPCHE